MNRSKSKTLCKFWIFPLAVLVVFVQGCATTKPTSVDPLAYKDRTKRSINEDVTVTVAVPTIAEAQAIYGVELAAKKIQPVWLEVKNESADTYWFLPSGLDPDYFSPLEVAFAYHKAFAADANAALNEHLLNLNFPIRSPIQTGSRASGYIFTNWIKGMKVIDVDLVGDDFSQNFTFFAPNPDSDIGQDIIERIESMFSASELQNVESEAELRQALEQLPCCVSNEKGGPSAEPLNVVIIGAFDDWTTAFNRRGYRYQVLNPRYAFGRAQDISGHKLSRGYTRAQAHTIRIWQTPIRYIGKPVWVAQTSTRLGGRFAEKAPAEVTSPVNPKVDEARYDLAQDLAYSQALVKIGFTKGAGSSQSTTTEQGSGNVHYTTDGLRVALIFGDRPASLDKIDFFDWERLADYR